MAIGTVVLVHGAFADGSCWAKVIPLLTKRGLKALAVQNPLSSLADDVVATHRVVNMQEGPVLMVGHSWGGAVIQRPAIIPRSKPLFTSRRARRTAVSHSTIGGSPTSPPPVQPKSSPMVKATWP